MPVSYRMKFNDYHLLKIFSMLSSSVCSSRGDCDCGVCKCDQPSYNSVSINNETLYNVTFMSGGATEYALVVWTY